MIGVHPAVVSDNIDRPCSIQHCSSKACLKRLAELVCAEGWEGCACMRPSADNAMAFFNALAEFAYDMDCSRVFRQLWGTHSDVMKVLSLRYGREPLVW